MCVLKVMPLLLLTFFAVAAGCTASATTPADPAASTFSNSTNNGID